MSVQPVPGVYGADQVGHHLPDLSSLSEEQRSAVAYMAQREAAALIRRALEGANERIELALHGGMLKLPIFHLDDIARIEARYHAR